MSIKNSNDTIGNQTHNLLACRTVPQPTAPPHALQQLVLYYKITVIPCDFNTVTPCCSCLMLAILNLSHTTFCYIICTSALKKTYTFIM